MPPFRRILLPTAFSTSCERARAHAQALAQMHGAELHVVHVQVMHAEPLAFSELPGAAQLESALEQAATQRADAFVAAIDHPTVNAVERDLAAAPRIVRYAREHKCDLIVMGTHARKGVARMFLGSVAAEVVRQAAVPVLVVGPDHSAQVAPYSTVMAAMDFSASAAAALDAGRALLAADGGRLIVEHVVDDRPLPPYATDTLAAAQREAAEEAMRDFLQTQCPDAAAQSVVSVGAPHSQLVHSARDLGADLLVLGTQGQGMLDRLLIGSTTERVLRDAPCPVLACLIARSD